MALITSLAALAGRFIGRVLTTTLGWASVLLFGRIPQDRQVWLAALTFGSLAWVGAVVGVLVPDLGAVLIAAAPLPSWAPEDVVRLAMLGAALVLPALIGAATLLLVDPEHRPRGRVLAVQVARGYALAPILAVTLVVLAVAGTFRKLDALAHRREDAHVPMVVRPGRYEALVTTLEHTLAEGALVEGRRPGSTILTIPARILARVAGRGIGSLVPDRLIELHGPGLAVAVYPSDLVLTGEKERVARARALVVRDVPSKDAWFTTTREAQEIEDRMAALESMDPARRAVRLPDIDRDLLALTVDQDTFEVLYRRRLQLVASPAADVADPAERLVARAEPKRAVRRHLGPATVIGVIVAILAAADLLLVALPLRRAARGRGWREAGAARVRR